MLQFDETLTVRYAGREGTRREVMNRLYVRYGEIPYFNGGIYVEEFGLNDKFEHSVRAVLGDFEANVNVTNGRVLVGDITINLPYEGV